MKMNVADGHKAYSAPKTQCFTSTGFGGGLRCQGPSANYALDQSQTADACLPGLFGGPAPLVCSRSTSCRIAIQMTPIVAGVTPSHEYITG